MSRGLGTLQRAILAELNSRPGGDFVTRATGYGYQLALGVHDLRQVSHDLAIRASKRYGEAWHAGFSRAVVGLQDRGFISFPSIIPLALDELGIAHRLADGLHLVHWGRRRRFVQVCTKSAESHNAYTQ